MDHGKQEEQQSLVGGYILETRRLGGRGVRERLWRGQGGEGERVGVGFGRGGG